MGPNTMNQFRLVMICGTLALCPILVHSSQNQRSPDLCEYPLCKGKYTDTVYVCVKCSLDYKYPGICQEYSCDGWKRGIELAKWLKCNKDGHIKPRRRRLANQRLIDRFVRESIRCIQS